MPRGKSTVDDDDKSGYSGIVFGGGGAESSEDTQLLYPRLIADSSPSPAPTLHSPTTATTMSQDAEDGPELLMAGTTAYTTRPPMNQEEFDQRFAYSRPTHQHSALARHVAKGARRYYRPCISCRNFCEMLTGFIPILRWLPSYRWKSDFLNDVVGGLTVGVMHVPQGIAYAILANVPPIVGLYTSFFPPLFYMFFGTSRHNSIGSFAVVSLMAGFTVDDMLHSRYTEDEIHGGREVSADNLAQNPAVVISSTLALCVGLIQLLMGVLRLEILTTYFSDQLIAGFTTAASCHVFVAQLRDFFGIPAGLTRRSGAGNLFMKLYDMAANIRQVNLLTIGISLSTLVFLILAKDFLTPFLKRKRVNVPLPYELMVVMLWTILSALFDFYGRFGVKIVNDIPTGIPQAIMPDFALLPVLIPRALSIAFVVMAVHISLAKMFAKKLAYKVDAGQELYALGLSASLSSLFPVYPVSCSLGRTMVNVEAGTKTQLSAVFSSALLGAIIIYVGRYLRTLPMCVLAATIIVALKGMTRKFKDLGTLWPLSKIDFSIWLVSFVATVAWDVTEGLAISICYALLTTVFRTQWPRWHYLANLNGTNDFRDAERYHRVSNHSGICIFRFDSPLLFTNVDRFKDNIHCAFDRWQKECPRVLTAHDLLMIPGSSPHNVMTKSKSYSQYKTLPIPPPALSRIESAASSRCNGEDAAPPSPSSFRFAAEDGDSSIGDAASRDYAERDGCGGAKRLAFVCPKQGEDDAKTRTTEVTMVENEDDDNSNQRTIVGESAVEHLNTVISTRSKTIPYISTNKPTAGLLYRHFVIDCSGFTFVDYMGVNALKEIFQEMRNEKVLVYFAAAKAPVRDLFEKSGFYQYVPKHNFYPTIRDAVAIARKRRNASTLHLLEELSLTYDKLDEAISSQPMD